MLGAPDKNLRNTVSPSHVPHGTSHAFLSPVSTWTLLDLPRMRSRYL